MALLLCLYIDNEYYAFRIPKTSFVEEGGDLQALMAIHGMRGSISEIAIRCEEEGEVEPHERLLYDFLEGHLLPEPSILKKYEVDLGEHPLDAQGVEEVIFASLAA